MSITLSEGCLPREALPQHLDWKLFIMKILTSWLRHYLPTLTVTDRQLADDLTLRGIAVEGVHPSGNGHGRTAETTATSSRWTSPPTASTP